MNPKVSVIIPVYNVEKYIEKCARSLFEQTLYDIEYIFIDDKTPDNSIAIVEKILKEYSDRQNQVKIIRHTENKGVSQSRQDGLDMATGEYVIHCDPDDWVETNMYELLYKQAKKKNLDIIGCDIFFEYKNKAEIKIQPLNLDKDKLIKNLIKEDGKIQGYPHNKLIKNIFLKNNNITFPEGINYMEDFVVIYNTLKLTDKIDYLPKPLYHYNKDNISSLTNTSINNIIEKTKKALVYIIRKEDNEKYKYYLFKRLYQTLSLQINSYHSFNPEEFRNKYMIETKNLLKYANRWERLNYKLISNKFDILSWFLIILVKTYNKYIIRFII